MSTDPEPPQSPTLESFAIQTEASIDAFVRTLDEHQTSPVMPPIRDTPTSPTQGGANTYSIGNLTITADPAKVNPPIRTKALYTIQNRPPEGSKEEKSLITSIITTGHKKYARANVSIKDPDSLTKTLALSSCIDNTRDCWTQYDLLDICNIVFPVTIHPEVSAALTQEGNGIKIRNLFTDYRQLTAEIVAASCAWYSKYATVTLKDGTATSLHRELNWSYQYFYQHVESDVYEEVNAKFRNYTAEQCGGPLFFWLLVDTLTYLNADNLLELIQKATTYNIQKDSAGEDINQVTRILSNLTHTISSIRHNFDTKLPDLYLENILKVYQTTSVPKFNEEFKLLEQNVKSARRFSRVNASHAHQGLQLSVPNNLGLHNTPEGMDWIWTYATRTYHEMKATGTWDEALRPTEDPSGFPARGAPNPKSPKTPAPRSDSKPPSGNRPPECWNCGEDHTLSECPHPRDEKKITINKRRFYQKIRARDRDKTAPAKWRSPEPHENGLRVINNQPHKWDDIRFRWERIETPPSGMQAQDRDASSSGSPTKPPPNPPDDDATYISLLTEATRPIPSILLFRVVSAFIYTRKRKRRCHRSCSRPKFVAYINSRRHRYRLSPRRTGLPPCTPPQRIHSRRRQRFHHRSPRCRTTPSSRRLFHGSRGRGSTLSADNDSGSTPHDTLANLLSAPSELHFFDALQSSPFEDALTDLPELFYACFDYFDPATHTFLNRYRETCTETYYDTLPPLLEPPLQTSIHQPPIPPFLRLSSSPYFRLSPTDATYHRILLQAHSLKAKFLHYDPHPIPMQPSIYMSSKPSELPIVIDTGASLSISPVLSDFSTLLKQPRCKGLKQLHGETEVVGEGTITWDVEDIHGVQQRIETQGYYVPQASIRLFSPQAYIQRDNTAQLVLNSQGSFLTLKCGTTLEFPINNTSNLPFMLTQQGIKATSHTTTHHGANVTSFTLSSGHGFSSETLPPPLARRSVLHRDNFNLRPAERELLNLHCKLGHADFQRVQSLLQTPHTKKGSLERGERTGPILHTSVPGTSSCTPPKCEACQYAKQRRKNPTRPTVPRSDYEEGKLLQEQLHPGARVSCDQYMSTTLGRLLHTAGKEDKARQLVGGTMFIDHATNYIFHKHQVNLTMTETLKSKHMFESLMDKHGIKIHHYSSDNHPFNSKDWVTDLNIQKQQRSLSGVGAHHQNYMERHIQTIFNWARACLLHTVLHWPQQANTNIWPFAIDYCVHLWNTMPARNQGRNLPFSPYELLTNTAFSDHRHLQRAHVFGCPVFVLDPLLQDNKKLPKWSMRSRRGMYLGVSPFHSSDVHLVLNPTTGRITPQYHLVFDDTFSTVFSNGQFDETTWQNLLAVGHEIHPAIVPDSTGTITLPPDTTPFDTTPNATIDQPPELTSPVSRPRSDTPHSPAPPSAPEEALERPQSAPEGALPPPPPSPSEGATTPPASTPEGAVPPLSAPSTQTSPPPLRRSSRRTAGCPPDRLTLLSQYDSANNIQRPFITGSSQTAFPSYTTNKAARVPGERLNHSFLSSLNWNAFTTACTSNLGALSAFIVKHQQSLSYSPDGTPLVDYLHPALLQVIADKSDTPSFTEAMNGPDAAGFLKAMEIEMNTLIEMGTFDVIDREPWMKVISSVWAFKVKRFPDGSIKKLKARLCARGYEQTEGVDYFETFAPVVQWLTVRLILIMTILLGLENQQIDYTAAFVQASIDTDVYVEMPLLFTTPGKVWKLKKCIYGLKQSPRNYFLHMKAKLEKLGFRQSDADPCLFISATVICLVYVDDALLVYKDKQAAVDLAAGMKQENMLFNVESDVAGYLGVLIERNDDGSIEMKQEGLTKRIIEALFLSDKHIGAVLTPVTNHLPIDEDGEPAHGLYNYASVVGMLNYLQGHSRIDISMAVSQVARYVHSPKRSHELALERIGRYLKGTTSRGLILRPIPLEESLHTNIYVDAAFACGWGTELGTNPDSVKSRTGYIVEVMGCSVIWCSKLQGSIATSTMESEYTALSMALRAAIPLLDVLTALCKGLDLYQDRIVTFKATVHEDNLGALTLANLEPGRHTPRSKFYALKLHWFRAWLLRGNIEVIHCPTKDQKADYLTKPLTPTIFEACRKLSMGW